MQPIGVVILAAYNVGGRWGWEAILVDPGGGAECHDAGVRYDTQGQAQLAGLAFCRNYWKTVPQVWRVEGVTLKGRRFDTNGY